MKHEITWKYLKGDKVWVGSCKDGDFWIQGATEQNVKENLKLHQHRKGVVA